MRGVALVLHLWGRTSARSSGATPTIRASGSRCQFRSESGGACLSFRRAARFRSAIASPLSCPKRRRACFSRRGVARSGPVWARSDSVGNNRSRMGSRHQSRRIIRRFIAKLDDRDALLKVKSNCNDVAKFSATPTEEWSKSPSRSVLRNQTADLYRAGSFKSESPLNVLADSGRDADNAIRQHRLGESVADSNSSVIIPAVIPDELRFGTPRCQRLGHAWRNSGAARP